MRKFPAVFLISVFLSACALFQPEPPLYKNTSYQQLPWARHSFSEMVARCRHTSLNKRPKFDYYEVRKPVFKACMEHYGYRYVPDASAARPVRRVSSPGRVPDKATVKKTDSSSDIQWNRTPAEIDAEISKSAANAPAETSGAETSGKEALYR